jgi:hypothetical protein
MIALGVERGLIKLQDLLGTDFDAQTAALAPFRVECNFIH